jgi:sulfur-oxidizing protein SoxB
VVAGWASVNESVEGPAVYDLMETYIGKQDVISIEPNQSVKVIG